MLTQEAILDALKAVKYPGYSRDIISFGLVKHVAVNNGAVNVRLELTSPNPDAARIVKAECENVIRAQPGVTHVFAEIKPPAPTAAAQIERCRQMAGEQRWDLPIGRRESGCDKARSGEDTFDPRNICLAAA